MPYFQAAFFRANELFATLDRFDPAYILEQIGDAESVSVGAERLGLFDAVGPELAESVKAFFQELPAALDAAIVAAMRSALSRGLRTQITWQPGYDFELRAWESSAGSEGALNIFVLSPHPNESAASASE